MDNSIREPSLQIPSSVELTLVPTPIPIISIVLTSVGLITISSIVAVEPTGRAERGKRSPERIGSKCLSITGMRSPLGVLSGYPSILSRANSRSSSMACSILHAASRTSPSKPMTSVSKISISPSRRLIVAACWNPSGVSRQPL